MTISFRSLVAVSLLAVPVPVLAQARTDPPAALGPAAGTSSLGDTGLWYVSAADVLPGGALSAGLQHGTELRDRNSTKASFTAVTLAGGLGGRTEVFGAWHAGTEVDARDSRGDALVGAKVNLLSERRGAPFGLAARGVVTLPIGSDRVSSGESDLLTELIASRRFGRAELVGSTGMVWRGEGDTPTSNGVRSGVGLGVMAHRSVRLFTEVHGERYSREADAVSLLSPLDTPLTAAVGASVEIGRGVSAMGGINRTFGGRDDTRGVGAIVRLGYRPGPRRPAATASATPAGPATVPATPPRPAGTPGSSSASTGAAPQQFLFDDVFFDLDRYTLRPAILPLLDGVVAELRRDASIRLSIEGYTCDIGTAEYNLALSERRASAVRDYLVARGVASDRLRTVGYGEERFAGDASEPARAQNRRAAMTVNVVR
jgi:peptidoglycan-associated lipoprotein